MKEKSNRKERERLDKIKLKIITFIASCEDDELLHQIHELLLEHTKTTQPNEKLQINSSFFTLPYERKRIFMVLVYDHFSRVILGFNISFRHSAQHIKTALSMAIAEIERHYPDSEEPIIDDNLDLIPSPSYEIEKKIRRALKGSKSSTLVDINRLVSSIIEKYNQGRKR